MTRKQVGVIYRAAKEDRIVCPAWIFAELYSLADNPRRKKTPGTRRKGREAQEILESVLSGRYDLAQEAVEEYAEEEYRRGNERRNKKLIGRPRVEIIEDLIEEEEQ